jgi:hypothetical protein
MSEIKVKDDILSRRHARAREIRTENPELSYRDAMKLAAQQVKGAKKEKQPVNNPDESYEVLNVRYNRNRQQESDK